MKLVGERRALAAAILGFYGLVYAMLAVLGLVGEMSNALYALAFCYGLAFFGLVAGYFWARWFAVGIGLFGVIQAAVGLWQLGMEPQVLFIGATHLFATAALWGSAMSVPYDGQTAWREKFHMDENAVLRLGRSVMRAGVSLPFVLLYAFAPKPDDATLVVSLLALGLAVGGLRALVQMKTWGVLALGGAGVLLAGVATAHAAEGVLALPPMIAGLLLLAATAPFASPIARSLARRAV